MVQFAYTEEIYVDSMDPELLLRSCDGGGEGGVWDTPSRKSQNRRRETQRERENGVINRGIFTLSPHCFLNYTDLTPLCSANAIAFP